MENQFALLSLDAALKEKQVILDTGYDGNFKEEEMGKYYMVICANLRKLIPAAFSYANDCERIAESGLSTADELQKFCWHSAGGTLILAHVAQLASIVLNIQMGVAHFRASLKDHEDNLKQEPDGLVEVLRKIKETFRPGELPTLYELKKLDMNNYMVPEFIDVSE